jgi:hypothetical protein
MKNNVCQFDHKIRAVSLENLRAMCERTSGTCHVYSVDKVTANRVYVSYSNPDEYANDHPITAVLPSFPMYGPENPAVVLDALRFTGGTDSEDWQGFTPLFDCEPLWRNPDNGEWESEYEIRVRQNPEIAVKSQWDKDGCVQTWFASDGKTFPDYREAQAHACAMIRAK